MGDRKKYLSDQFRGRMLYLEHDEGSDFYLSSFQNNNSALPLLIIRFLVLLGCVGMLLSSIVLSIVTAEIDARYWLVFMTHWGILSYTACSFFGTWVSFTAYTKGSIDCTSGLPWFVKAYWFCYNVALPTAFFITIFYYTFLSAIVADFAVIDPVLDVFIHGVSSIFMMTLLLTARLPSHIMHFYQPFCVSLLYLTFLLVYYFAGGTDQNGNPWIYPNIDWRDPGPTSGMVVASSVMILALHGVVVLISLGRNWFRRRYITDPREMELNP